VRLVADAFGPDRLCWGGGTPGIVDAHLDHFSAAERAQVKGGNLARLLGYAPQYNGFELSGSDLE